MKVEAAVIVEAVMFVVELELVGKVEVAVMTDDVVEARVVEEVVAVMKVVMAVEAVENPKATVESQMAAGESHLENLLLLSTYNPNSAV